MIVVKRHKQESAFKSADKTRMPRRESAEKSEWDITWKDALAVFRTLSGRRNIEFYSVGPDQSPLGSQPITGFKISGNNLFIYGKQTGYIIFGSQVKRVIRTHIELSGNYDKITLLFSPYLELEIGWTN